jgi:hypothetical protein
MQTSNVWRAAIIVIALVLEGCAQAPRLQGRVGQHLSSYRAQPHYRAFAVARGTSYAQSYSAGWTYGAPTARVAMDQALANCNRNHDSSLLAPCRLFELGNIQVYDMDEEQLAIAECVYNQRPAANSMERATLASCRSAGSTTGSGERSLERYRSLGPYRALATTGDPSGADTTLGWSRDAVAIRGAVDAAMRDCERRRDRREPDCRLYAIGDLVVAGVSEPVLERAECLGIMDPAATSLDGPDAARCDAAVAAQRRSAAGDRGETVLSAEDVRTQLVGNTARSLSGPSFYVHVAADGTLALRTAREPQREAGIWRLTPDGRLCAKWQKLNVGQETCNRITRAGDIYRFDETSYSVIEGNPLDL